MSDQTTPQKPDHTDWTLPTPDQINAALTYFHGRRSKPVQRTITFKLHSLTKLKIRILLDAMVRVTNLIAAVLRLWHEDSDRPRHDGAVAAIFKTQQQGVFGGFRSRVLSNTMAKYVNSISELTNSPLAPRMYEGAYRTCASMLVSWTEQTLRLLPSERKATPPTMHTFYEGWERLERAYRHAMSVVASLGTDPEMIDRLKPQQLERKSKREARWLLQRLRPEAQLRKALERVEALLSDQPSALQREADFTEHLWLKQPTNKEGKHRRGVREGWVFQRVVDAPGNLALLGNLDRDELEDLRDQIQTVLAYIDRGNALIDALALGPADRNMAIE